MSLINKFLGHRHPCLYLSPERSALVWMGLILLSCVPTAFCQAQSSPAQEAAPKVIRLEDMSPLERQEAERIRSIANRIRSCPESRSAYQDGSSFRNLEPVGVIWNVAEGSSIRSRLAGYIEFTQNISYVPKQKESCKKRDSECLRRNEILLQMNITMETMPSTFDIRYEFDLSEGGLEFVRALSRVDGAAPGRWTARKLDEGCTGKLAIEPQASSIPPLTQEKH